MSDPPKDVRPDRGHGAGRDTDQQHAEGSTPASSKPRTMRELHLAARRAAIDARDARTTEELRAAIRRQLESLRAIRDLRRARRERREVTP